MFHEMLHIKHPARIIKGRRYYHTAAFRAEEKSYPSYVQAQEWLDRVMRKRQRDYAPGRVASSKENLEPLQINRTLIQSGRWAPPESGQAT